jgi:hypothetical protein
MPMRNYERGLRGREPGLLKEILDKTGYRDQARGYQHHLRNADLASRLSWRPRGERDTYVDVPPDPDNFAGTWYEVLASIVALPSGLILTLWLMVEMDRGLQALHPTDPYSLSPVYIAAAITFIVVLLGALVAIVFSVLGSKSALRIAGAAFAGEAVLALCLRLLTLS